MSSYHKVCYYSFFLQKNPPTLKHPHCKRPRKDILSEQISNHYTYRVLSNKQVKHAKEVNLK